MLSTDVRDNESKKFRDAGISGTRVAVSIESGILSGLTYDDIQITYPSSTIENYAYYLSASLVATLELTYSNACKTNLTRARRI